MGLVEDNGWTAPLPDFGSMRELFAGPHTRERRRARLGAISRLLEEHPERLNMDTWHGMCGTVHCLAGWAIHLAGRIVPLDQHEPVARHLLGDEAAAHFFAFGQEATVIRWLQQFRDEAP